MKKLKKILYPLCLIILVFACWNLWKIKTSTRQTEELYEKLAQQADSSKSEPQSDTKAEDSQKNHSKNHSLGINTKIQKLQQQNEELVGWLKIDGTVIDYPVMQTATDNDYYLTHDFERNDNVHGTPFLDVNCSLETSDNLIIYGHHMKDGTMFQNLMLYRDAAFCTSNEWILWDTLEESTRYRVVFVIVISKIETETFPYYDYVDLSDKDRYQEFLDGCSEYAVLKSSELPHPGTKLLTLSTCEYSKEDGRLVIVAAADDAADEQH